MATTRNARSTRTKSDVIEVNFDDYEETAVYMGDDPRAGVYPFRLAKVERHIAQSSGNKGIRWTFICEDPSYEGWAGFMYSNTDADSALFKTQQILAAVQGGNTKPVKLDLANPDKFLATCKPVIGRVKSESYEGDDGEVRTSAKLTRVVAASAVPQNPAKGKGRAKDEDDYDDDFDDADDAGDDEGFDDDELREELEGKTIRELRAMAKKDYGLTVEDIKGLDKAALIDEMLEAADDNGGDGDDEDDDGFDDVDVDEDEEEISDEDDTEEDAEEETPTPPTRSRSGRGRSRSEAPAKAVPAKKASPATRRRRG